MYIGTLLYAHLSTTASFFLFPTPHTPTIPLRIALQATSILRPIELALIKCCIGEGLLCLCHQGSIVIHLGSVSFDMSVLSVYWYVTVICSTIKSTKLLASFEYSNNPEILWRLVRATVHGLELSLKGITQQMYRVMVEQNEKRARHAMELAPKNKSCLLVSC